MRFFIESVRPNVHILWCRSCNDVRMGRGGTCANCRTEMWDVHKPDALQLLAEEGRKPGTYPDSLLRLCVSYVGKDVARKTITDAWNDQQARNKRRESKRHPCATGKHRRVPEDGLCECCERAVCRHEGCGNLAGEEGLCGRHRREMRKEQNNSTGDESNGRLPSDVS